MDFGVTGHEHHPPRSFQARLTPASAEKERYACPYLKHAPGTYGRIKSCLGGWPTVSRVKEHLTRAHKMPPQCSRCGQGFRSAQHLAEHLRAAVPCILQIYRPLDGLTDEQLKRLRGRNSSQGGASTEKDKWNQVYKIAFPDEKNIPSPYFEPPVTDPRLSADNGRIAKALFQELKRTLNEHAVDGVILICDLAHFEESIRSCIESATGYDLATTAPMLDNSMPDFIAETSGDAGLHESGWI